MNRPPAARASRRTSRSPLLAISALVIAAGAVAVFWYWQTYVLPRAARVKLTPVTFAALSGWAASDARAPLAAFRRSCAVLEKQSPEHALSGAGYAGTASDWQGACGSLPAGNVGTRESRRYFEDNFTPVAVSADDGTAALFTGYYEPEIRASAQRHPPYLTPIYGLPQDLVTADLGLFKNDLAGVHITGRIAGNSFVPYFSRGQIDADGLAHAPVLFYADDPVQIFFLHIQGSGRAHLDNGAFVRLAYAGQNGRPYTPVGRTLIENGQIDRASMSMQAIRGWMQSHPADARRVMESDESFVFFRTAPLGDPSLGSPGSEGVPLTPGASIAVDMHLNPLGAPFYIAATAPDPDPARPDRALEQLFVAQDTGGAIKGAARADIFWGFGRDEESVAGRMKSTGKMFVLLPKALARTISAWKGSAAP